MGGAMDGLARYIARRERMQPLDSTIQGGARFT